MANWMHLRLRFPPFDEPAHEASELPIADVRWLAEHETTELNIGTEESWFVHRSQVDSPPMDAINIQSPPSSEESEERRLSRSGWALSPHPMHQVARKLIPLAVLL